jgi:hypothetical protein
MLFVTTDSERWGAGVGPLTARQFDLNFWELRSAINDIIANPLAPIQIAGVTAVGRNLTFHMDDGTDIGPIALPVVEPHWRGDYPANTALEDLDIFRKVGVGLYLVIQPHMAPAEFDPTLLVDGNPAYFEMFAFAPAANLACDVGAYYPGVLKDISTDVVYLYQEPFTRKILIPKIPFEGTAHQAYLQEAPSTDAQDFDLYLNDVVSGNIHFAIGANIGTITLDTDLTLEIGSRFAVGRQLVDDATAAMLSFEFAAIQVIL